MDLVKMSDRDVYAIESLLKCPIRPSTIMKRWVDLMYYISRTTRITSSTQIDEIWRLIYKFKKYIKDKDLIEEARNKL